MVANGDMYEIIYPNQEKLHDDDPLCENQDLFLGGPNNLEDGISFMCHTQDEDNDVSSGATCFSSLNVDGINQDLRAIFFFNKKNLTQKCPHMEKSYWRNL